jgi:hypothetical protein
MTFGFPKAGKRNMTAAAEYGAKRVEHAGRSFASKLEAAVFDLLCLREKAGEIRDIKCQVRVKLSAADIVYIADFGFENVASGRPAFSEAKGFETDIWRIKRRLWIHYGPGILEIWRGSYRKPYLDETIVPQPQLGVGV